MLEKIIKLFYPTVVVTDIQENIIKRLSEDINENKDQISAHIFELGLITIQLIEAEDNDKKNLHLAYNKYKEDTYIKKMSALLNIDYHWGDMSAGSNEDKKRWEDEYRARKL